MTDEQSLLRAILADPGDDTVRLAYADWLEEHDQPARAEFIRVQIQLAMDDAEDAANNRLGTNPLRRRERELWQQYAPVWFSFPGYHAAAVWDHEPYIRWCRAGYLREENVVTGGATRGFVSAITTTAAAFLGGEVCEQAGCHLMPAPSILCNGCHGTGRTEGIAAEVFLRHPVTSVTLSDRVPYVSSDRVFGWCNAPLDGVSTSHLGQDLFAFLPPGAAASRFNEAWRDYPTRDAALAALSAACVRYGRALAGLPAGSPAPG